MTTITEMYEMTRTLLTVLAGLLILVDAQPFMWPLSGTPATCPVQPVGGPTA